MSALTTEFVALVLDELEQLAEERAAAARGREVVEQATEEQDDASVS